MYKYPRRLFMIFFFSSFQDDVSSMTSITITGRATSPYSASTAFARWAASLYLFLKNQLYSWIVHADQYKLYTSDIFERFSPVNGDHF